MKRLFDILAATIGLLMALPLLTIVCFLVWRQDRRSPFYLAPRVGKDGRTFTMVKVRSMRVGAATSGVDSTAANDQRITPIGRFVRRYKIDEIVQLWNVVKGEMSLVGPRPNVHRDVALYTEIERRLLTVRPGMTDLASIVFADEGEILKGHSDPDLRYHQVIRPWKSRLGLFYIEHRSFLLDLQLIYLTVVAIISRRTALFGVQRLLEALGADTLLTHVAARDTTLTPYPPPGAADIVLSR